MTTGNPLPPSNQDEPLAPATTSPSPKVLLAVLATGLVAVILAISAFSGGSTERVESDLLASQFQLADGSSGSLGDFNGEPLVVNFFASWCAPCRAELPDFEEVHQERNDVTFVGVNTDIAEATWLSFVEETAITYDTVFQPSNELFSGVGAKGMPTTAFFSADGELLHSHSGLLTKSALNDLIDIHLRS